MLDSITGVAEGLDGGGRRGVGRGVTAVAPGYESGRQRGNAEHYKSIPQHDLLPVNICLRCGKRPESLFKPPKKRRPMHGMML